MDYDLTENKRENIILRVIAIIEGIDGIVTVNRTIPSLQEYFAMPESMCPYVAVVSKLPIPRDYEVISCPNEVFAIEMNIEIWFFGYDNEMPDSGISFWHNEICQALYTNPTLGGLIEGITIMPESDKNISMPNYAFLLNLKTFWT